MRKAEQGRQQAEEYLKQASTAKTVIERAQFEELALTWQRLATGVLDRAPQTTTLESIF